MNLSLIHNIFGRSKGLQRSDIEAYGKSDDPLVRNAVEQKAASDPFDADAMEGWEALGYDTGLMASADKRFMPRSYKGWYVGGGIAVVAGIVAVVYFTAGTNDPEKVLPQEDQILVSQTLPEQQIALDESDIVLPEQIEEMEDAPKPQQLPPASIKQDFQEIQAIRMKEPPVPVAELPVLELRTDRPHDLSIIKKHELAKEIYLHDFKLIDYRNYRSKPQIKTRQMILTGLPANFEDSLRKDVDPEWRDVDIPYIDYIDKSMRIFGQGNYKKALSRFETILDTYDMDVNARFYAGLCLYNLGEYDQAIPHFDLCISGPYSNFDEEALWMKALSYEHLGERNKARNIFERIAKERGFYAEQAAKKIK